MTKIKKGFLILLLFLVLGLVACNGNNPPKVEYKIPNLTDQTKQQIIDKFDAMDIDITLEFIEYFEKDVPSGTFWEYKTHRIGDVIKANEVIVIYITATSVQLPDLKGLNIAEIRTLFDEMGVQNDLLIFKPTANSAVASQTFVSYQGYQVNDKHDFSQDKLTIYYKDATLPNLSGLNEEQIRNAFTERNLIVTLDFKLIFKANANNTFSSYQSHNVGDEVTSGELVTILIASKSINLPNLRGKTKTEIEAIFADMNVPISYISFRGEVNTSLGIEEFIRYGSGFSAGKNIEPSVTNKIEILYNLSSQVPNLEGLNKEQIIQTLKNSNITVLEFSYIIDNAKEFDSFAKYGSKKANDMVDPSETFLVYIYQNDDVNVGMDIVHVKQVFISKYIDGIDLNKGIEIYNPTNETIDLSQYYLAILANGSLIPTSSIVLSGQLLPGATFVVVNDQASDLLAKAQLTSGNLVFDGNDTIQLRKVSNDTYIDTIYHVGNISATLNGEVFVRRSFVTSGNRSFTQSDWFGFVPTFYDAIGVHPFDGDERPGFILIEDKTFQQYGMTKVELVSVADGDTIYVRSLDPRDTTSYMGDNRLRFLLVDTPETQKPGVTGEPYANVATYFTKMVLEKSTTIYIQADPSGPLTETYGRHLALIWFHLEEDYIFTDLKDKDGNSPIIKAGWSLLNYELVRLGLGEKNSGKVGEYQKSPIYSNRYLYSWADSAFLYAQENKLGLNSGVHMD